MAGPIGRGFHSAGLPPRLGSRSGNLSSRVPEPKLGGRLPPGADSLQGSLPDDRLSTLSLEVTVYSERPTPSDTAAMRGTRNARGSSHAGSAARLLKGVSAARRHRGNEFGGCPHPRPAALPGYRIGQDPSAACADGGSHEPRSARCLARWNAARTNAAIGIHQADDASKLPIRHSPAVSCPMQVQRAACTSKWKSLLCASQT